MELEKATPLEVPTYTHTTPGGGAGHKSSFSTENGNCVVVDIQADRVLVRDSKDPEGPALSFTPDEYLAFWMGVMNREFDPPAEWLLRFSVAAGGV
ncbi:hypothetical protein Ssi03_09280 [Sphaerisporangium siamense]|uniref:DUF397 domain-containing protein n=1 Tax=Sphaerisporangium siamense TaxID=795645 RepID=A0A7W7DF94_9ACTN|nr:DUF397 domain-containing protein [Sphaerisporangium siamense]MBB4705677.1 hypothetical protein [Sphaerisporangium siamense]GII82938.1 hypothetical protein Ssi03_09280 [Sphaerisporangium siamense]